MSWYHHIIVSSYWSHQHIDHIIISHLKTIWDTFGIHLGGHLGDLRLRRHLGGIWRSDLRDWNSVKLKCKSSIHCWISRSVFESRCHQVWQVTLENHPRQQGRIREWVIAPLDTIPSEPLHINLSGELLTFPNKKKKVRRRDLVGD